MTRPASRKVRPSVGSLLGAIANGGCGVAAIFSGLDSAAAVIDRRASAMPDGDTTTASIGSTGSPPEIASSKLPSEASAALAAAGTTAGDDASAAVSTLVGSATGTVWKNSRLRR
jgi:hypothetical protein